MQHQAQLGFNPALEIIRLKVILNVSECLSMMRRRVLFVTEFLTMMNGIA